MLKDFRDYVVVLARHWLAYVTGSVVLTVIGLIPALQGKDTRPLALAMGLVLGIPVAGFFAWREERRRNAARTAAQNKKIKTLCAANQKAKRLLMSSPNSEGVIPGWQTDLDAFRDYMTHQVVPLLDAVERNRVRLIHESDTLPHYECPPKHSMDWRDLLGTARVLDGLIEDAAR